VLAAYNISKSYRGRKVIEDVSVYIERGEIVGLLGPNGAGKTTVFSVLTGATLPDRGLITLDGFEITRAPLYERARYGMSYLPQEPSLFRALTVEQNMLIVLETLQLSRKRRSELLDALLREFNIESIRKSPASRLSGGERRRCEIARTVATDPMFIMLDEPFAGIDPIAIQDIRALMRYLAKRGIGVLISDHNVRETLSAIDRAYIIESGRILTQGTVAAVVANPDVRSIYLGSTFRR
jgi:lipopolysaccharide export system ATP-binding protein